jgi:Family of unknown function (DUF6134)
MGGTQEEPPGDTCPQTGATRREVVALVGGGVVVAGALGQTARADRLPPDLAFDVSRKGRRIGTHTVRFAPAGDGERVTSQVALAVKMAFVTVYRYGQTGEDEWRDGVLVRTRIRTNDDGEDSLVETEAGRGALAVSGPAGRYEAALGTMTDLNFWNEAITRQGHLIDGQTGELIRIAVRSEPTEKIPVLGQMIQARRFAMTGTKGRSGTIWYDQGGRLVKAVVVTRGETLGYELAA